MRLFVPKLSIFLSRFQIIYYAIHIQTLAMNSCDDNFDTILKKKSKEMKKVKNNIINIFMCISYTRINYKNGFLKILEKNFTNWPIIYEHS